MLTFKLMTFYVSNVIVLLRIIIAVEVDEDTPLSLWKLK